MSGRRARRRTGPGVVFLVSLAATVVVYGGMVLARRPGEPRVVVASVAGKQWSRSVEVQAARTVVEEGPEIPTGAFWVETVQVVVGRRRVLDLHATTVDTVSVYRQAPLYGPRYRYRVARWEAEEPLHTRGGTVEPPEWPQVPALGPGRQIGRTIEDYRLTFTTRDGGTYWTAVSLAEFLRWQVGAPVRLRVDVGGFATLLGGLESGAPAGKS